MISKYFDKVDSDEFRQLRDRYQSLSECKKIEVQRQISNAEVIHEKIGRIELSMRNASVNIKQAQGFLKQHLFSLLLSILFLALIPYVDFGNNFTLILWVLAFLGMIWTLFNLSSTFFNLHGWLNHDKNLELERSLLWIDFKHTALISYSPVNSVYPVEINFQLDDDGYLYIVEQVIKYVESA